MAKTPPAILLLPALIQAVMATPTQDMDTVTPVLTNTTLTKHPEYPQLQHTLAQLALSNEEQEHQDTTHLEGLAE